MDPGENDEVALEQELSQNNPALAAPSISRLPVDESTFKEISSNESGNISRVKTNPYNKGWRRIVSFPRSYKSLSIC
jgi:hypothetical protein